MRRCITLVNKIKDAVNFILKSDGKRVKIIVALGLAAIILIAFSSLFQSNDNSKNTKGKRFHLIIRNTANKQRKNLRILFLQLTE